MAWAIWMFLDDEELHKLNSFARCGFVAYFSRARVNPQNVHDHQFRIHGYKSGLHLCYNNPWLDWGDHFIPITITIDWETPYDFVVAPCMLVLSQAKDQGNHKWMCENVMEIKWSAYIYKLCVFIWFRTFSLWIHRKLTERDEIHYDIRRDWNLKSHMLAHSAFTISSCMLYKAPFLTLSRAVAVVLYKLIHTSRGKQYLYHMFNVIYICWEEKCNNQASDLAYMCQMRTCAIWMHMCECLFVCFSVTIFFSFFLSSSVTWLPSVVCCFLFHLSSA